MADPLTDAEIAELRDAVTQLKRELQNFLKSSADDSKPVDLDQPIGRLSRMDAIQQQHMATATRSRYVLRLKQVEGALQRLKEDDEYGYCVGCDDPIGYPRLKARPETPLCLMCQDEMESA